MSLTKTHIKRLFLIILTFFLLSKTAEGQTLVKNSTENISLLSFEYIHDTLNEYTSKNITNAAFQKVKEPDLNWGKKNGFYWFKVHIKSKQSSEFAFNIPTIHIDTLKLYKEISSNLNFIKTTGNKVKRIHKNSTYLHNYIPITITAGLHVFYIKVYFKHEAYFPVQIQQNTPTNNDLFITLLYYGFSLMMITLNIILFVFFKETVYIAYVFFLSIITLSLFYDDGLFTITFPYLVNYYDSVEVYIHWLTSIGVTWFCFSFLNIKSEMPKLRKWFLFFIIISFILYTCTVISFNFTLYKLAGLTVYIIFIGNWILAISFFKKYYHVRILVFAYAFILFSSLAYYLLRVEGIQFIKVTPNNIKFGGIIEIIFITISILYRFKILKKENDNNTELLLTYLTNTNTSLNLEEEKQQQNQIIEQLVVDFNLTNREKEILQQLTHTKTNREIASTLFISISTVKFHISNILIKLNVKNRHDIIAKTKE